MPFALCVAAAHTTIRNRFYRDIRLAPSLRYINDPYYEDLGAYATEFFGDKEKKIEPSINAAQWAKKTGDRKIKYAKDIANELTTRGFPSAKDGIGGIIKGFAMRYEMMSPGSKRAIKINSAITAAIGFGGMLTFFHNLHTRQQMDSLAEKIDFLVEDKSRASIER